MGDEHDEGSRSLDDDSLRSANGGRLTPPNASAGQNWFQDGNGNTYSVDQDYTGGVTNWATEGQPNVDIPQEDIDEENPNPVDQYPEPDDDNEENYEEEDYEDEDGIATADGGFGGDGGDGFA